MPITKREAFRAIAEQARKRAKLDYDESAILSEERIASFAESPELKYKRLAEVLLNKIPKSGGHPHYDYLAEIMSVGTTEEGVITTLFMDLKNFTKYCCFLTPTAVFQAKSASIETVIGICRVYGGHLHSITGDGVMFFFGGRDGDHLQFARNAVNAAADSMDILGKEVMREYNSREDYPSIHPKIGVDYGSALWGAMGAAPHFEAKATSFNVDIANKMMGARNSQEVAVGDELRKFIEIDEGKFLTKDWCYERELTVSGQLKTISYPTYIFDWNKWLENKSEDNSDLAKIGIVQIAAPFIINQSRTQLAESTPLG